MRILTGSVIQESNTFSPLKSDLTTFRDGCLLYGEQSLSRFRDKGTEVSGFLDAARDDGVDLLPSLTAWASSGGPMDPTGCKRLVDDIITAAAAQKPFDGVLLALHGAWASEDDPDADGYLLARVRDAIGPTIPIAVTLDLHANVTRRMVEAANLIVGFRTYPHIDMRETGERAARLLFRTVRGGLHPVMAIHKAPMLLSPEFTQTTEGPMAALQEQARADERRLSCMSASIFPVQPWLDVPELGFAALVVSDGDRKAAQEATEQLARAAWNSRDRFSVPLVSPAEAVVQALAAPEGPILLVDSADSTSSGSPGDSTALLEAFLATAVDRPALLTLVDPVGVAQAVRAGVGATLDLLVGGKLDPARHRPVGVHGVIERVTDGRFAFSAGVGDGLTADMGRTAVLRIGNLHLVLMEKPVPCYDPALYRSVGFDPRDAHIVVVKSPTNFRWTYRAIARQAIYVDAPGASTPRLTALTYRHAPRPLYPLDKLDKWDKQDERRFREP
jgi:microcystin degradation protein MlrC